MIPCLTLCLSRYDNQFVIINYALNREFGYAEEYGPLVWISYDQMAKDGLQIVTDSLANYSSRQRLEKSEFELLSTDKQREFDCRHKQVAVSLQKGGAEIWLGPMHDNKKGGLESRGTNERVVVRLPSTNDIFMGCVLEAFKKAE